MIGRYRVVDVFDTVQGEGARAGARSVFVRFAGCNAWSGRPTDRAHGAGACAAWCDTDFVNGAAWATAPELRARMDALWPEGGDAPRWCVLTGGEPLLQLDAALCFELRAAGWKVAVETNGSVVLDGTVDWLCVSPKLGLPVCVARASELKVVVPGGRSGTDGWRAADLVALADRLRPLERFVQPQDPVVPDTIGLTHLTAGPHAARVGDADRYRAHVAWCLEFVRAHPGWRLGFQGHKLLGVP